MGHQGSGEIGRRGEDEAVKYLESRGYRILSRNWRSPRWGELDIVCERGSVLVFVEVKTRAGKLRSQPFEAVNFFKIRALVRTARHFKLSHPDTPDSLRVDVVSVTIKNDEVKVEHLENIYEG